MVYERRPEDARFAKEAACVVGVVVAHPMSQEEVFARNTDAFFGGLLGDVRS